MTNFLDWLMQPIDSIEVNKEYWKAKKPEKHYHLHLHVNNKEKEEIKKNNKELKKWEQQI